MCPIAIIYGDRGRFDEGDNSVTNYKFRTEAEVWEWWDKNEERFFVEAPELFELIFRTQTFDEIRALT